MVVTLVAGCTVPEWSGLRMAPGTPGESALSNPAKAVLARYLPHRADDPEFQALVEAVLRSSRGQKIALESGRTTGELDAIRQEMQRRGLPPVFIGIPMWESYLDTEAVSYACAAGAWQLMPETAIEFGLAVQDCDLGGSTWSPEPGTVASPDSPYRAGDRCAIRACAIDDRKDLARSTVAALDLLTRWYDAPDLVPNPDRAALTVLSYNTGLGAARQAVSRTSDPFAELQRCARGECEYLGKQGAMYVPGVTASAALSTCGAAFAPDSPFADEAQTTLCQSLADHGLLPRDEPAAIADAE
ncbi:MAG: transglycosylase SLT domain-containing protein [Myxococcota bacterium]